MKRLFHLRKISITLVSIILIFSGMALYTHAENVITSGTTVKVTSGTTLVSVDNLVIKSGATLDNAGTVILKKDLANENASPNSIGSGTAEMSGTSNQNITGQNIITNLTVNNAAGITIGGNTTVNGNLTLTSGRVLLGSNNLKLGPTAVILGTPSASVMIIVTGTGELRKEFPTGFTGSFIYPVGDNSGTAEYSPVTLTFVSGTFASGNYVGVSLANTVYPDPGITGNYLNRYWKLTQSGITTFSCNASFQYLPADVVGTESVISCTKVNPLPWTTYALTNATTHVLSALGITSFSYFTGLKSTTAPANQEVVNAVIGNGVTNCYDATQVLTIAGNGTTFIVNNGGSATLVAGNKISILPGTIVYSGGYMHAYISTNAIYCPGTFNPLVANPVNADVILAVTPEVKNQLIKFYPNPTNDFVIIEVNQDVASSQVSIDIYNMNGQHLISRVLNDDLKHPVSLISLPEGIYIIHARSENKSEIAKIVKY